MTLTPLREITIPPLREITFPPQRETQQETFKFLWEEDKLEFSELTQDMLDLSGPLWLDVLEKKKNRAMKAEGKNNEIKLDFIKINQAQFDICEVEAKAILAENSVTSPNQEQWMTSKSSIM